MDKIIISVCVAVFAVMAVLVILICKLSSKIKSPHNKAIEDEEQIKELRKIKEKKYGK